MRDRVFGSLCSEKGAVVPYVSAQYPENSTKSLPGDLPYFMTPDYNEIKPMSVYEPWVLRSNP